MLLIGIDEAGYGPRLGPLCHGYSVFRCAETAGTDSQFPNSRKSVSVPAGPDLWALLHPAVMRHPAAGGSITVDDSKKVYSTGLGLGLLTQGVSAFLECIASAADGVGAADGLYQRLIPGADRARLEEDPWARKPESTTDEHRLTRIPSLACPEEVVPALKKALKHKGLSVLALGARALSAKHFNAALGSQCNKAEVSWSVIAAELRRLLALCADGENINVVIDRQGGRRFYAAHLGALFPGAVPWAESEEPEASVYKIETPGRTVRVAFQVNAESSSLPVALASMAAKLARELCMARLNVSFQSHIPDLEPTAGYAQDARRFLRETKEVRRKLGIADSAFVRMK